MDQVRCQLEDRDAVIAEQTAELDSVRAECSRLGRDNSKSDAELSALQMSVCRPVCLMKHNNNNINNNNN